MTLIISNFFFAPAHRDVGFGLGAVEVKRETFLLAVEGAQPLGPYRRDELLVLQLPVEIEDPVQVHRQTSAFINDDAELLQLPHSKALKNKTTTTKQTNHEN